MAPHMRSLGSPIKQLPGSLELWEQEHRAGVRRAAWRALKITTGSMLGCWIVVNCIGLMVAAGCGHRACAQPDWWPSWFMLPSRLLLGYLNAIVAQ